jgi:DNA-binding MarR family transcriptional regulator
VTGRGRLANDAWESLLQAHAVLVKELAAQGMWTDISMREYDVLYTLAKCREPLRLAELNRYVLLSQPALSRLVDRLVARGLVRRDADPADGRGVRLSLTADGRARQRELGLRHARDVTRAMHARVSLDELATLTAICHQLAGIDEAGSPARPPNQTTNRIEAHGYAGAGDARTQDAGAEDARA